MILASKNILEAPILLHSHEEGFLSINALKKTKHNYKSIENLCLENTVYKRVGRMHLKTPY